MDEDDGRSPREAPPKLTIGQRILTALPNLERQRPPTTRTGADAAGSGPAPEAASPPPRPQRMRDAFSKPAESGTTRRPDPTAGMSNEELTHAIKRIDDREQRYAFYAGPLGAVIGIVLMILAIHYDPAAHHKGHVAENVIVLEGVARVVLGALVVLAAVTRRRSFVAFALLFLGTAMGNPVFAVLWWALGGWMIWRVFRYQKVLTARGAGPQRANRTRAAQNPRSAARSGATDARALVRQRREARARKKSKEPAQSGPPASKRYTPPKPSRAKP